MSKTEDRVAADWARLKGSEPFRKAGEAVSLRPVDPVGDAAPLFNALDHAEVWTHIPSGRPIDPADYAARLTVRNDDPSWLQFLIEAADGSVLGTTTLSLKAPSRAEIGSTTMAPRIWGTGVNTAVKHLMLSVAFDDVGVDEVVFRTDVKNLRSQRAIQKLGAVHIETAVADVRRNDGSLRDTMIYRIGSDEWPTIKRGLGGVRRDREETGDR